MNSHDDYLKIRCPKCSWTTVCDPGDMIERLRRVRMLRRQEPPEIEVVVELFRAAAGRLVCDRCAVTGLIVELPADDDLDWGEARCCEVCGGTIPKERLELFPDTQCCAKCQAGRDVRGNSAGVEYCPKCGSVMVMRATSAGGISRYQLRCDACGR
jgi:hypothetical protein